MKTKRQKLNKALIALGGQTIPTPKKKITWNDILPALKKAVGKTSEIVFIDSPTTHTKETIIKPEVRTEKTKETVIVKEIDSTEIERLDHKINYLMNRGGGSINRQEFIGGVNPLTRYTDINWKAGAGITLSYADNNITRQVDITVTNSVGDTGIIRAIASVAVDTNAGAVVGTDYVYLVTGTTTITLPTAIGNSNLYTIKNVGVGTVTIATTGGQTVDGDTTLILPMQYTSVDITSSGTSWNLT